MIVLLEHNLRRDRIFLGQSETDARTDKLQNFFVDVVSFAISTAFLTRVLFTKALSSLKRLCIWLGTLLDLDKVRVFTLDVLHASH